MAFDFGTLQTRSISGKGVLKIQSSDQSRRFYILYVDVIRDARNKYENFTYNPSRGRYATLVFLRRGYVQCVYPVEFARQEFRFVNDVVGQQLIALKCVYQGLLETFVNLGNRLAISPFVVDNSIIDYANIESIWDEVRVVCYADTAVRLTLKAANYESCDGDFGTTPNPDIPPDEPTPAPPGTPVDVSPPYDSPTDDGNTVPYPGDSPPNLSYTIKVIGSSYGGGCFVFPDDDVYVTLTDTGSGNYGLVDRGGFADCGGFNFWVKDLTQDRIIYTNTSPGKSLHLEVTLNP